MNKQHQTQETITKMSSGATSNLSAVFCAAVIIGLIFGAGAVWASGGQAGKFVTYFVIGFIGTFVLAFLAAVNRTIE